MPGLLCGFSAMFPNWPALAATFSRKEENAENDTAGKRNGALAEPEEDGDAAGWDLGDDVVPEVEEGFVNVESIAEASNPLPWRKPERWASLD
ncbi:hypothetical protein B0T24DRAFT_638685 [Lasiosphaeria ovina]|uniref:Uncharacterized protein n=1 Tax=Lasiosphaeria ovina TaxID=92902 RepID=A0AAE0MZ35_9PEZI|nr:hypothetical protein B0T24DRAFT_638685 [Lasiosphaeria ovina]